MVYKGVDVSSSAYPVAVKPSSVFLPGGPMTSVQIYVASIREGVCNVLALCCIVPH
jgi:hypothetical protein